MYVCQPRVQSIFERSYRVKSLDPGFSVDKSEKLEHDDRVELYRWEGGKW